MHLMQRLIYTEPLIIYFFSIETFGSANLVPGFLMMMIMMMMVSYLLVTQAADHFLPHYKP